MNDVQPRSSCPNDNSTPSLVRDQNDLVAVELAEVPEQPLPVIPTVMEAARMSANNPLSPVSSRGTGGDGDREGGTGERRSSAVEDKGIYSHDDICFGVGDRNNDGRWVTDWSPVRCLPSCWCSWCGHPSGVRVPRMESEERTEGLDGRVAAGCVGDSTTQREGGDPPIRSSTRYVGLQGSLGEGEQAEGRNNESQLQQQPSQQRGRTFSTDSYGEYGNFYRKKSRRASLSGNGLSSRILDAVEVKSEVSRRTTIPTRTMTYSIEYFVKKFVTDNYYYINYIENVHRSKIVRNLINAGLGLPPIPDLHQNPFWEEYKCWAKKCDLLLNNTYFKNVIVVSIGISCLSLGLESDPRIEPFRNAEFALGVSDAFTLSVFTLELLVRIVSCGLLPWMFFYDNWNCFDFFIILVSFLNYSPSISVGPTVKCLRILRILKLVRQLPQLKVLLESLFRGVFSLGYIGMIVIINYYVFAIFSVLLFKDNDPFHFGLLHKSLMSLFIISSLDNWTEYIYVNYYGCDVFAGVYSYSQDRCKNPHSYGLVAPIFVVLFTIVSTHCLLTLIIGVIFSYMHESLQAKLRDEEDEKRIRKIAKEFKLDSKKVDSLKAAFDTLDTHKSGTLDMVELRTGLMMFAVEIEGGHFDRLFKAAMESDGITRAEFIKILCDRSRSERRKKRRKLKTVIKAFSPGSSFRKTPYLTRAFLSTKRMDMTTTETVGAANKSVSDTNDVVDRVVQAELCDGGVRDNVDVNFEAPLCRLNEPREDNVSLNPEATKGLKAAGEMHVDGTVSGIRLSHGLSVCSGPGVDNRADGDVSRIIPRSSVYLSSVPRAISNSREFTANDVTRDDSEVDDLHNILGGRAPTSSRHFSFPKVLNANRPQLSTVMESFEDAEDVSTPDGIDAPNAIYDQLRASDSAVCGGGIEEEKKFDEVEAGSVQVMEGGRERGSTDGDLGESEPLVTKGQGFQSLAENEIREEDAER